MYNVMSCSGWGTAGTSLFGQCSIAWIIIVLVIGLAAVLRRQCIDGILTGTSYNSIGGFAGGAIGVLLLTTLFGDPRWSLLAGIIGIGLGGFALGLIMPSDNDSRGYE